MTLREYLEKCGACKEGIDAASQYATPQEAWDKVKPEYLIWATCETTLVSKEDKKRFARWCALSVAHLWDMPPVVREYLENGNESLRVEAWKEARPAASNAASAVAWAASEVASEAAVWAAASEAASDAAWAAAIAAEKVKQAAWIRENIKPNWEVLNDN